jgi:hypothetical protein
MDKESLIQDYVGWKVTDYYGRVLGVVLGYSLGSRQNTPLLGIEFFDGTFGVVPVADLVENGGNLALGESWKNKAEKLLREQEIILRRITALNKLHGLGEVSKETFENLSNEYNSITADLANQKETLVRCIKERLKLLCTQIKDVEHYLVNLKLSHEVGDVNDETYKVSCEALNKLLNSLKREQQDLENAEVSLASPSVDACVQVKHEPPPEEVPILLRIKEAGA